VNDVHAVVVSRVSENQWHALDDDQVVGRGNASRRPDGRVFVSVDAWHEPVFERLAEVMLADLPRPLSTMVDEADLELLTQWESAGFAPRRREWEYLVPTDSGPGSASPPPGVTIVALGEAEEVPLRALDRIVRDEVEVTVGWQSMPAEVLPRPDGFTVVDPSKYAVAVQGGEYVGLVRLGPVIRRPRIGLIAVRADRQRRGIARALLVQVLDSLRRDGISTAFAEVDEANRAAAALFDGVGAKRVGSTLELVLRGRRD
jgi:ribosomal protein S18 acetylase RimI-like enzyme